MQKPHILIVDDEEAIVYSFSDSKVSYNYLQIIRGSECSPVRESIRHHSYGFQDAGD